MIHGLANSVCRSATLSSPKLAGKLRDKFCWLFKAFERDPSWCRRQAIDNSTLLRENQIRGRTCLSVQQGARLRLAARERQYYLRVLQDVLNRFHKTGMSGFVCFCLGKVVLDVRIWQSNFLMKVLRINVNIILQLQTCERLARFS